MELKTNQILKLVLEVLEDYHPAKFPVHTDIQDDLSPTKAALQLGETRGYSKVLNTIKLLAKAKSEKVDVGEPTYTKEEPVNA